MSIPSVTRSIYDPTVWSSILFKNIEPAWLLTHPNDGLSSVTAMYNGTQRLFEAYTPNSTKDHKTWKAFEHFKAETNYAHGGPSKGVSISADLGKGNALLSVAQVKDDRLFNQYAGYGQQGWYNSGLSSWYVPRTDGGFIPTPSDLESLKQYGLKAMRPTLKANLSSLVSLYEIKDLLSIKGTIKNFTKLSKRLFHQIGASTDRTLGKAVAHAGADGYLQWMFNLRPLLSDIDGIYRTVATHERRVNDLVNRSGTVQQAHFKCDLKELLLPSEETYTTYYPVTGHPLGYIFLDGGTRSVYSDVALKREFVVDSAVFRSTMQYNYTFTAFQREHSKVLGLLDLLGVNFNPKYLWDVIPWSFVIDWVFDVGQWLEQFEVKNMEPRVNILQYCWSIKKTRRIRVSGKVRSYVRYGSSAIYPQQYIELPQVNETSYRRGIDLPSASSFTTSGLSSTELSLGAALLVTRKHPQRRNKFSDLKIPNLLIPRPAR